MNDIDSVTCAVCGALTAGVIAESCERGDCPIERKPAPSIYPYPRFGRESDAEVRETKQPTSADGAQPQEP